MISQRGGDLIARAAEKPPAPAPLVSTISAAGFEPAPRRTRWLALSFAAIVGAPTLLIGVYMSAFASERFVSEYRVAVRSVEPLKSVGFPALLGLAGSNSQAANDAQAVVQFLQSREPVDQLEKDISLRARFDKTSIDWWSRLSPNATIEEGTRYWRSMVDAYYEASTGTIIVRVSAFTPKDAFELASRSLSLSEALINRLSEKVRDDTLAVSQAEVDETQRRLSAVNEKLRALRDTERTLDPRKAAESTLTLAARLSTEIAQLRASLYEQSKTLNSDAPSIEANRRRLDGLEKELADVNAQITTTDGNTRALSGEIGAFEQLQSEATFAEKAYQSALSSLETARLDAERQQVYLATIVRPATPQEASFPRPLRATATAFGAAFILWAIGVLVAQAVREHL
jgi:capsular polysaccharide transport system permease protein